MPLLQYQVPVYRGRTQRADVSLRHKAAQRLAEITHKLLDLKLKMLLTLRWLFCILVNVAQGDKQQGRLAQLGEHLPYKQGVIGSSPIVPTKDLKAERHRS